MEKLHICSSISTCVAVYCTVSLAALLCIGCAKGTEELNSYPENDTVQECPTWFIRSNTSGKCKCGSSLSGAVQCSEATQEVWLKLTFCMTYDEATGSTLVGECSFSTAEKTDHRLNYVLVPSEVIQVNETFCGKANRKGLLCSKCKAGYGPPMFLYGVKCTECSASQYSWLLFLLLSCVPMIIFFLVLILCQIRTTSAALNCFIIGSQILSISLKTYPQTISSSSEVTKVVYSFFLSLLSLWNLDFLPFVIPPFCVGENLSNLQVLCMEYIVAFSPLLVIVIMYICIQQHARGCRVLVSLWKPFGYCLAPLTKRFEWNPAKSIVHIFASFLLLSSTKILFVSFSLLKTTRLYSNDDSIKSYKHSPLLFYDPSIVFFSKEHLPYAFLAITVSVTFVVLPCLVLILYPTRLFQECLNCCRIRWHAIHVFADAFNGCYKDGTDGTRDCRSFAGFYLFLRISFLLLELVPFNIFSIARSMWIITALLIFTLASPYKARFFNVLDSLWLALTAYMFISGPPIYEEVMQSVGALALTLYFFAYANCQIIFKLNFSCCKRLKAFAERVTGKSKKDRSMHSTQRDYDEESLPDRILNPKEYELVHENEDDDEQQKLINCPVNGIPTYGIIP